MTPQDKNLKESVLEPFTRQPLNIPIKTWAATGYLQAVNNMVNNPNGVVTADMVISLIKQADMPIDALIEAQHEIINPNAEVTAILKSIKERKA